MAKNRNCWSQQDIEILTKLYSDTPTRLIAEKLNCSERRVYRKALNLGLRKSDEYMESAASGRLDGHRGSASRFQKGKAPWNKGISFKAGGRSSDTQFKTGMKPHNYKPIGSYRVDPYGTLQLKISDEKGANNKRWRSVHELVWVEANGPVPKGHIVVFKEGMKSIELDEITLDAIECISRSENMERNSIQRYPESLRLAIQMRGVLNRKIRHVTKHQ